VSDTMGRAWRNGLTDVALGAAGIEPFRDHRGEIDPYGNELQLTQMAVIDELASAGELVKGKCDQVPVAVVRGYPGAGVDQSHGAVALLRDAASDMFSLGTTEARQSGLRDAARMTDTLPGGPIDPAAVDRALAVSTLTAGTRITPADILPENGATAALHLTPADGSAPALMLLGADAQRLRAALAAEGIASALLPQPTGILLALSAT